MSARSAKTRCGRADAAPRGLLCPGRQQAAHGLAGRRSVGPVRHRRGVHPGISRAIGETMIVAVAAGMQPRVHVQSDRAGPDDHGLHRRHQPGRNAARHASAISRSLPPACAVCHDAGVQHPRLLAPPALSPGVLDMTMDDTSPDSSPIANGRTALFQVVGVALHARRHRHAGRAADQAGDRRPAASWRLARSSSRNASYDARQSRAF